MFQVKLNTDNSIDRYKARQVAREFKQEYGTDYLETFSPVVRFSSIRTILAVAAKRKMKLKQSDVKTAFLYGDLNENIFMEHPTGFSDGTGKVCKLRKSLHGLKQSSRCWNQKFTTFVKKFGFTANSADSCVFVSDRNKKKTYLSLHVDDGLIVGDGPENTNEIILYLQTKFEIKLMDVGCFLGVGCFQKIREWIDFHPSECVSAKNRH